VTVDLFPAPEGRPVKAAAMVVALVVVLAALVAVMDSSVTTQSLVARPRPSPSSNAVQSTNTTAAPRAASTSAVSTPTADAPLRLWVGGDSLAAGPSWAVFVNAKATGVIKPLAEYQVGTGLVRNEFWDWPKHVDAVVRARNPQVSVFMVGANDDQGIDVNGTALHPPDQAWVDEYARRVDAVMATLTAHGRRLIWIGMPPMRDPQYSQSMGLLDLIFASEARKHRRVTYVDTWTMFSAPGAPGTYAQYITDESGQPTNMRLDDGIHLNVEGSQYLARAVMTQLAKVVILPPS
jgi:uncharacterized protein